MCRIKSKKYIGKQPVYNMTVENTHNYILSSGIVSHNCDALRYFSIYWTVSAENLTEKPRKPWRADQWEDYYNASETDKALLIEKWGEPL